ncbi:MAG: hypothetical protein EPN82_14610 [Bacteroidetes bacterium]|nr:MAG: hypothetical protein EPN82_14610 [Bacteroidota bacterium]
MENAITKLKEIFEETIYQKCIIETSDIETTENYSEKLNLYEAKKLKADAVYFRRYYDEIKEKDISTPIAYIYVNNNSNLSIDELSEIHKLLWNSQKVFIYIVIDNEKINLYNPRRPGQIKDGKLKPVELCDAISITSNVIKLLKERKLSSEYLQSNLYLEHYNSEYLEKYSPYLLLLNYLKETRKKLLKDDNIDLSTDFLNKLLVMLILIKFIEEKKDDEGKTILDYDTYIWKSQSASSFINILLKGNIIKFLDDLSEKFDGNIFTFNNIERKIITNLTTTQKQIIADYFKADIDISSGQGFLWKQYSFNHLPIELISGIYEAFLSEKDEDRTITYTPPYLVNLLIDNTMPLDEYDKYFSKDEFRVFDPACGSGIFLVAAFKRMVEWKILKNYKKTKKWESLKVGTLKKILTDNIFGTDTHKGAPEIAIFSLSIAICRFLTPISIWNELQFDDLSKDNVLNWNFFKIWNSMKDKVEDKLDLIIGNPPFKTLEKKSYLKLLKDHKINPINEIPRYEIAFLFLDKTFDLLKSTGRLCLIQPSKLIYNQTDITQEFFTAILNRSYIEKIFDFSHLSDIVFRERAIAICAVIINKVPYRKGDHIKHYVAQRLSKAKERIFFDFDYYNIYTIEYENVLSNKNLWKTNLMGGGRLLNFVNRFNNSYTLKDYLKEKKIKSKWVFATGYKTGQQRAEKPKEWLKTNYKTANFITNHKTVYPDNFNEDKIKIEIEKCKYFESPRKDQRQIFLKPHILIRLTSDLFVKYIDFDLCFTNSIVGIHSPNNNDIKELKSIVKIIQENKQLYQTLILITSGYTGVTLSNSPILLKDILNLPFPKDNNKVNINYTESLLIHDVLNYLKNLNNNSIDNELNKIVECEYIEDKFAPAFCFVVNKIYEKGNMKYRFGEIWETSSFFCVAFYYGMKEELVKKFNSDENETQIRELIENDLGVSMRINRILRLYIHKDSNDVVYLIKPKLVRFWLPSIALRDADDVINDLYEAGF